MLFKGVGWLSSNCPNFTEVCLFLFELYACSAFPKYAWLDFKSFWTPCSAGGSYAICPKMGHFQHLIRFFWTFCVLEKNLYIAQSRINETFLDPTKQKYENFTFHKVCSLYFSETLCDDRIIWTSWGTKLTILLCHCLVFLHNCSVRIGNPWLFRACFYIKIFSKCNCHTSAPALFWKNRYSSENNSTIIATSPTNLLWKMWILSFLHCVKRVHILSFSSSHFPAFGLNTERYGISLRTQSKCWKIRTIKAQNTDTFHAVLSIMLSYYFSSEAVLQGMAKNKPTKTQIDPESQTTLKHGPARTHPEGKM